MGVIIELGLLLYNKQVITNASREGARAGIVCLYDKVTGARLVQNIEEVVEKYCTNRLVTFGETGPLTVTPATSAGLVYPDDLTVKVTYEYTYMLSSLLNFLGADLGPSIEIGATTVMRVE